MATCDSCGAPLEGAACTYCGKAGASALGGDLARPSDVEGVAHGVADAIPSGSSLTVSAGETFVGWVSGHPTVVLSAGRHRITDPLEGGAFVLSAPASIRLALTISELGDAAARIFGEVRFAVTDPAALVEALADPSSMDAGGLEELVGESAGEVLDSVVRAAFEDLDSADELEGVFSTLLERATAEWPLPGTTADLSALSVSIGAGDAEEEDDDSGESEEDDGEDEGDFDTSLIGEEVTVVTPDGSRVSATVQEAGYLVRFANGETRWVPLEAIEIE